jgi:hypothetical protein
MMKTITTLLILTTQFCWNIGNAQTEFVLNAGDLIPHDDGYFLAGITYDFNKDGIEDFVNGCPTDFDFEDYERRTPTLKTIYELHRESGMQEGFTYKNCMLMPVCDQKYVATLDPALSFGYIQMRPLIDTTDLELSFSYIESPSIRNLQSITIETSPDVHIQADKRQIPYNIEYSKDGGVSYVLDYFISDVVQADGGSRVTYTTENSADFTQIQADSKTQNIKLRFSANYDLANLGAKKGQYVKVHKISIVADEASTEVVPLTTNLPQIQNTIVFRNGAFSVEKGSLNVFTISGQLIGSGQSVAVVKGLYLVVANDGTRKKFFIQ